jgi:DNA-directed RNA polymerase subunit beta'
VRKPETINYRTYRPEKDGLFCEKIFGPTKDWECFCGKYKGIKHKNIICDRCGVQVTHSKVRRTRMGHINLAAPVAHIWFFKATPSRIGNLLAIKLSDLDKVIYFQEYVVTDAGDTALNVGQLVTEEGLREARQKYGASFEADMGAEAIKKLLLGLDLPAPVRAAARGAQEHAQQAAQGRDREAPAHGGDAARLAQQAALDDPGRHPGHPAGPAPARAAGQRQLRDERPERPLPPPHQPQQPPQEAARPQRSGSHHPEREAHAAAVGGRPVRQRALPPARCWAAATAAEVADRHDQGQAGPLPREPAGQARGLQRALGHRGGPELHLHQCGLPKVIALELYQPFIIRRLKELGFADTIKSAKKMLERKDEEVWDILEEVIKEHPVLLNRAPTLHRMGIQAFQPVLVEGNAIRLHPLVCAGFNAGLRRRPDGRAPAALVRGADRGHGADDVDQQHLHARERQPDHQPQPGHRAGLLLPDTTNREGESGQDMVFSGTQRGVPRLRRRQGGRARAHQGQDRRRPPHEHARGRRRLHGQAHRDHGGARDLQRHPAARVPFWNMELDKGNIKKVISEAYEVIGKERTVDLLDALKELGFKSATRAGLSFAASDLVTPKQKETILGDTDAKVLEVNKQYGKGVITEGERYNQVIDLWTHARERVGEEMMKEWRSEQRDGEPYLNPVFIMERRARAAPSSRSASSRACAA